MLRCSPSATTRIFMLRSPHLRHKHHSMALIVVVIWSENFLLYLFNSLENSCILPFRAKRVKLSLRTSFDSIPRVPASPQVPTRLTFSPERSYGSFSRFRRCQAGEVTDRNAACVPRINRSIERSRMMNMSTVWGGNKAARKRKRTVRKAKIRWDVLGLQDPALEGPSPSMEDIRRQVTSLASRGLGPGTRSRSGTKDSRAHAVSDAAVPSRKRRRGATE